MHGCMESSAGNEAALEPDVRQHQDANRRPYRNPNTVIDEG